MLPPIVATPSQQLEVVEMKMSNLSKNHRLQPMFPSMSGRKIERNFPLVWKLYNAVCESSNANTYFENFKEGWNGAKRKSWKDIESDLTTLDANAWKSLKAEVIHRFSQTRDTNRGWQAAFDIINEVKAYRFLKEKFSVTELQFILKSKKKGQKTPDLCGKRNGETVLCEVKTINPSKEEIAARNNGTARNTTQQFLSENFWEKLKEKMKGAYDQMTSYDASASRIIYVIFNFDDNLNEYVSNYISQIKHKAPNLCPALVEVIFDIKPPYYSATSISPPSTILHCSTKGCTQISG